MNRRTVVLGAAALSVIAFAGGTAVIRRQREAEAEAAGVAAAAPPAEDTLLIRAYSPILGPTDAPVTLVEFFGPSCEACRAFHPVVNGLRQEFPDQLRVVLRYAALHPGSDEAVRILEGARRQDLFEPVLEALLAQQPIWAAHGQPQLDLAWQAAGAAGMNVEKGMAERLHPGNTAILNQEAADMTALRIAGTPTFFLNGKPILNPDFETLPAAIRAAVAQAQG
jgi:protein-disulfide isomerase